MYSKVIQLYKLYTCVCVCVCVYTHIFGGFPYGSAGKESTCNAGDLGLIPGLLFQILFHYSLLKDIEYYPQ